MNNPKSPAPPVLERGRPPIIEFRKVSKAYAQGRDASPLPVLHDLSLVIEDQQQPQKTGAGYFVVLLGPSGCGKSTILSMIAGLTLPDQGEVFVFGRRVTGPHQYSATVPQAYTCFPWLTSLQNVEFGLSLQDGTSANRRRAALEYLAKVGLLDRLHAYPKQLSGGMQQRVSIARTLALKRPIVLMDEPFGALDAQTRADMQEMLIEIWEAEKNTIVFVTHDITEALRLADRVIVFSSRPARVVQDLIVPLPFERPPDIVHTDAFIKCENELRALLKLHRKEPLPVRPRTRLSVARITAQLRGMSGRDEQSTSSEPSSLGEIADTQAARSEIEEPRERTQERSPVPSSKIPEASDPSESALDGAAARLDAPTDGTAVSSGFWKGVLSALIVHDSAPPGEKKHKSSEEV